MESTVSIDGSFGEGGGQILRTSLALSSLLQRPFEIYRIRANRPKPGLQPQHLACVKACERITMADVEGASLGSTKVYFSPHGLKPGDYQFDVAEIRGSAGAVTLVLQGIILPLSTASSQSHIVLRGGTHVPWSPSFNYFKEVFIPFLQLLGIQLNAYCHRWGFYPRGGGEVEIEIIPGSKGNEIDLTERGRMKKITGVSAVSNLPIKIAERQRDEALRVLKENGLDPDIDILSAPSPGKGTFIFLIAEFENSRAGFSALGAIGKRAEEVGREACEALLDYYLSGAVLDPWMADQIIPYMAASGKRGRFTTSRITKHLLTNCWVAERFLPVNIMIKGKEGEKGEVIINA